MFVSTITPEIESLNTANKMAEKIKKLLKLKCLVNKIDSRFNHRYWMLEVYTSNGKLKLGDIEIQWFALGGVFIGARQGVCKLDEFRAIIE